ncbi:hypothetical protein RvY_12599 [Ramazzottius varieornatus]|uniref:Protein kinase domain-containing protein n=1 Tax=Ramazzottius varieornatus TaxID=947166 RepID=A0A1D1VK40_RAMVA|nr:hypothetical protein RvY_12599 [Ramazzottius varieornatus]
MDFSADSPTTSTPIPKGPFTEGMSPLVAPVSKRLCFDEAEIVEEGPKSEMNLADISVIRRGLNGMDMADDSMMSHNTSFNEKSPHNISRILDSSMLDFQDESGLHDVNISISPQNPSATSSPPGGFAREVAKLGGCSTPNVKTRCAGRRSRLSYGEVPKTPVKSKDGHRSRASSFGVKMRPDSSLILHNIMEEPCNINPFSEECVSVEEEIVHTEEIERRTKRNLSDMLCTPETSSQDWRTPESGYGTRNKVQKTDKVVFSLGSPFSSADTGRCHSPSMSSSPVTQYERDFVELDTIASGQFGHVTKVRKRLDGVIYAVKRIREEGKNMSLSEIVHEVFALSALESHPNVVRYFNSWSDGGHLYLQTEYCDGGTLGSHIVQNRRLGKSFAEDELRRIVLQTGSGLHFLHNRFLAHLDVKPDNIFIACRKRTCSNGRPETPDEDAVGKYTYKLGDMGHVQSFRDGTLHDFCEGDRDYLAPEILHDMQSSLLDPPKADVYSLGITLFETAQVGRNTIVPIDFNSAARRNGVIPGILDLPLLLNQLIQKMTTADPRFRSTMADILADPALKIVSHPVVSGLKKYAPKAVKKLSLGARNRVKEPVINRGVSCTEF